MTVGGVVGSKSDDDLMMMMVHVDFVGPRIQRLVH